MTLQKITPCLWFDTQADEAVRFCCSIMSAWLAVKQPASTECQRASAG